MPLRPDQPGMEDAPLDPIPAAGWSLHTHTSHSSYSKESNRNRDPGERRRMALMSEGGIATSGKISDQWEVPSAEITMGRVMREENREVKRSKGVGKRQ